MHGRRSLSQLPPDVSDQTSSASSSALHSRQREIDTGWDSLEAFKQVALAPTRVGSAGGSFFERGCAPGAPLDSCGSLTCGDGLGISGAGCSYVSGMSHLERSSETRSRGSDISQPLSSEGGGSRCGSRCGSRGGSRGATPPEREWSRGATPPVGRAATPPERPLVHVGSAHSLGRAPDLRAMSAPSAAPPSAAPPPPHQHLHPHPHQHTHTHHHFQAHQCISTPAQHQQAAPPRHAAPAVAAALVAPASGPSSFDASVPQGVLANRPSGQHVQIDIVSTWGDPFYVGLSALEFYDAVGDPIEIEDPAAQARADPADINVLPEYGHDVRVVSNLLDGSLRTCDNSHLWLAPFTSGQTNYVNVDLGSHVSLSMIRVWNYNKSRIHSFRGARLLEIRLDGALIFRGEVNKAPGALHGAESAAEPILFTLDAPVLARIEEHDRRLFEYEPVSCPRRVDLVFRRRRRGCACGGGDDGQGRRALFYRWASCVRRTTSGR